MGYLGDLMADENGNSKPGTSSSSELEISFLRFLFRSLEGRFFRKAASC